MLDFIRDIFASFRQTSLERIKSPFLGAFVFSWLGFNWQMLAILFLSKESIETRLDRINKSFEIGSYLLGPICTTALIVIILPQMNKLITRIQDKPNSDTISLGLHSKIRIANLQQELAESEAKKKLADKKEERYIEDGIALIKETNERYEIEINEKDTKISALNKDSNDLLRQIAKVESQKDVEVASKLEINKELTIEKEKNRALGEQVVSLNTESNKYRVQAETYKELRDELLKAHDTINQKFQKLNNSAARFNMSYPFLVEYTTDDIGPYLQANKNAVELLTHANNELRKVVIGNHTTYPNLQDF